MISPSPNNMLQIVFDVRRKLMLVMILPRPASFKHWLPFLVRWDAGGNEAKKTQPTFYD